MTPCNVGNEFPEGDLSDTPAAFSVVLSVICVLFGGAGSNANQYSLCITKCPTHRHGSVEYPINPPKHASLFITTRAFWYYGSWRHKLCPDLRSKYPAGSRPTLPVIAASIVIIGNWDLGLLPNHEPKPPHRESNEQEMPNGKVFSDCGEYLVANLHQNCAGLLPPALPSLG